MTMLVSSFNLSQSFNYAPYVFCKKRFKSEINCFCIRTLDVPHARLYTSYTALILLKTCLLHCS
jgi:hypothetical protein